MIFVPCPSCSRHVRVAEAACPFCSAALPDDLAARAVPGTGGRRLGSRLAAFTFAAGVVAAGTVAAVGCSGKTDDGGGDKDSGSAQPLYGSFPSDGGPATDGARNDGASR